MNFILPTKPIQIGGAAFEFVSAHFHGNWSEQGSYLGLPLVAMVVVSFRSKIRPAVSWMLLITMMALVVLSLGPVIRIFGNQIEIWAPWQLVLELPLIRHALPSRLSVYLALLTAIATSYWLAEAQSSRSRTRRYGFCLLAIVFLLPNPQLYHWNPLPLLPPFERLFGAMPNLAVLPLTPSANTIYPTMIWQFQSGMAYTQTGGYLGSPPPESYKWPATSQLVHGVVTAQFAKDIEAYAAAHNITAIIAGPGTPRSLLHSLDELGWDNQSLTGIHVYHVPKVILP